MDSRDDQATDNDSAHEAKETHEASEQRDKADVQEARLEKARDFDLNNSDRSAERQKKAEIVEEMVSKDLPISPEKRLDNARDFHYADEKEFGEELEERYSSTTEEDKKLIDGFYNSRDNQAFVKEDGDTFKTSIHEKLHQKSMSELPTRLNEGVTEYMAKREAGPMGDLKYIDNRGMVIPKAPSDYEKEVETVSKLSALVGDKNINSAYFEGKTEQFRISVDGVLGDGAFKKISEALEKRDYDSVSKIIERHKNK